MARLHHSFRSILVLFSLVSLISACGGGGDDSPDRTPDAFSFTAETEVERSTQVESAAVTITGIERAVDISISGGEYQINDGGYTSTAGTVSNGQSVQVRLTSSSEFSTDASLTLTAGGVSGTFTATTIAQDITPEAFSFASQTDRALSTQITSASATVSGINDATAISIDGGEYSINNGTFTDQAGEIEDGDGVRVRLTSSANFSTDTVATLTIGGVDGAFTVTTLAQDITPDAFAFDALANVSQSSQQDSAAVAIAGLNDAAPITIVNGQYAIDDGEFTSDAGLISNGQEVTVRVTSSALFSTEATATLSIGPESATVDGTFTVTTLARDDTPEAFEPSAAMTGATRSTVVNFTAFDVAGLNDTVDISIDAGSFTINSGSAVTSGTVQNGDSVVVSLTSSPNFSTAVNATLTIGSLGGVFSVVTEDQDIVPDAFSFTDVTDLEPSTLTTSNSISVSGINDGSVVSVENGEYSIDDGDFTSDGGTVTNGQSVRVRTTSSASLLTATNVVLTIGGVSDTYTLTTLDDTNAPEVDIAFPPPVSMTEGTSVTVRGTATDDYSDIALLRVNDLDVTTADDFATWSVSVPLSAGDNTLTITAEDAAGNEIALENRPSVDVHQDVTMGDFPDSVNPLGVPRSIAIDANRNRLIIGDSDLSTLIAVDLSTGARTTFSDNTTDSGQAVVEGLLIDNENNRMWMSQGLAARVFEVDIDTGVRTLLSSNEVPVENEFNYVNPVEMMLHPTNERDILVLDLEGAIFEVNKTSGISTLLSASGNAGWDEVPTLNPRFSNPWGRLALDIENNRLFVTDNSRFSVVAVSLLDGGRTVFSDPTIPNSDDPLIELPKSVVFDPSRERLIVNSITGLIAMDVNGEDAGVRSFLSSPTIPNSINAAVTPSEIVYNGSSGYLYLLDESLDAVLAIDIVTGERVFITRGDGPEAEDG